MRTLRESSERSGSGIISSTRAIFRFGGKHGAIYATVAGLSVLVTALNLAQPYFMARLLNAVELGDGISVALISIGVLVIVAAVLSGLQRYALQALGEAVVKESRDRLIGRMLRLSIAEYDQHESGDLVSRISSDTSRLQGCLIQATVAVTTSVLMAIGAAVMMALVSPSLTLVSAVAVAVAFAISLILSRPIRFAAHAVQDSVGQISAHLERVLLSIRMVRAANGTTHEQEEAQTLTSRAQQAGLRLGRIESICGPVSGVALQSASLTILGFGGYEVALGHMTIATLISFTLLLYMLTSPVQQMIGAIASLGESTGAFNRIEEVLMLPVESEYGEANCGHVRAEDVGSTVSAARSGVVFQGVSFSYAHPLGVSATGPRVTDAVSSLTFQAELGRKTALVGPSGAGKSTVFQLVEGFYAPTSGHIRVLGRDVGCISRHELREIVAYVEQDSPAMSGTLRDNLLLARENATDEELTAVLRQVKLDDLLARDGLDLVIGEQGNALSGGERQRLAIARVLLTDAKVVLLDEVTANLDGISESVIKNIIGGALAGRAVLAISHRLSTVVSYDRIYVLSHGRLVGEGTHAELLETSDLYRALAQEQRIDLDPSSLVAG